MINKFGDDITAAKDRPTLRIYDHANDNSWIVKCLVLMPSPRLVLETKDWLYGDDEIGVTSTRVIESVGQAR